MDTNVLPSLESTIAAPPVFSPLAAGPRFIRFGPFQVDQQRQEVVKEGARLKLQGKVYQVLVALLEKPGEVVTREELRQRLWPADTHVNYDANVNTTVNKLRQVLGDSTDKPLYIETIPRKGYCLLAQPEATDVPLALPPAPAVDADSAAPTEPVAQKASSSRAGFWVPIGAVGLILIGMLLGAGITIITLLTSHFAQVVR